MLNDAIRFFYYHVKHYSLALWGLRLRFDPMYPFVYKFFPAFLAEPVLEYRTYGLHAVFALVCAAYLPAPVLTALVLFWGAIAWDRSHYLKSNVIFWRQVLKENGLVYTRAHGRLIEALIREMERRMKAGEPWEEMAQEAARLQDDVIRHAGSKDAATRILAGV